MTNFIIGAICGIIFAIAVIFLLGYIMDRVDYKSIRKQLGEDFEIYYVPKSKIKKLEKDKNYVEEIF